MSGKLKWHNAKTFSKVTHHIEAQEQKRPDGYWRPENQAPITKITAYIHVQKRNVFHLGLPSGGGKTLCKAENGWGKKNPRSSDRIPPEGKSLCVMCDIVAHKMGIQHEG